MIRKVHIDAYGNVNEVKFELNGVDYLLSKMLSRIEDLEDEVTELKSTLKKPTIESKDISTQTEQRCKGQRNGGEVLDTTLRPYFYQPQRMSVCDQSNVSYIDVTPNLSDIEIFRRSNNVRSDDYGTLKWTNSPLFKK